MTHPAPHDRAGLIDRLGNADEIQISTRRPDGTLRRFVPIWVVTVDRRLYVRSYRGADGAWYRHANAAASAGSSGAIRVDGQQLDVTFTDVDPGLADLQGAISEAYRAKYARYGNTYLQPMLANRAVATTLRLDPIPESNPEKGR
jgi:hypothetical protein